MSQAVFDPSKKVLFIGHTAARSGAPISLLHFLRWLKQNSPFQFEVLLQSGGPLEGDFSAVAPTTMLTLTWREELLVAALNRYGWKTPPRFTVRGKLLEFVHRRKFDFVYANTVAAADEVAALAGLGWPVVWHIHEMPFVIRYLARQQALHDASRAGCAFIACSEGVKQGLISDFGVPIQSVRVIHEFIPAGMEVPERAAQRASCRTELALPADAFVAGMCGTVEWRKGADWFVATARHLITEFPTAEIYLVWIGPPDSKLTRIQIEHDLRLERLEGRVRFTGGKSDTRPYLAALDAFVLSSREDPFPLAMLEAASLALPILCFNHSGGGPEFVEDDAGIVVEYGDTLGMAKALIRLSEQPALREQLGLAAHQKAMDRYTVERQAPKILEYLRAVAHNGSPGKAPAVALK